MEMFEKKPVITLVGPLDYALAMGDKYSDEGATAHDDKDGDISDKIVVSGLPIDTDKTGHHTVRYDVKNSSGVSANAVVRHVSIINPRLPSGINENTEIQQNPNGRYILAPGQHGLYVFDKLPNERLVKILPYPPFTGTAAVAPDGQKIAVIHSKKVELWDTSSWIMTDSFNAIDDDTDKARVHFISYSPLGDSIATCGSDKKIRLWRSSSLTHLSTIDIVSESVSIKFNKDGTKITDGSRSWYVEDGSVAKTLEPDSDYPWKKAESPPSGGSPWEKVGNEGNEEGSTYPWKKKESETTSKQDELPSYPWSPKGTYVRKDVKDENGQTHTTWDNINK